jgi:hypothetical protein
LPLKISNPTTNIAAPATVVEWRERVHKEQPDGDHDLRASGRRRSCGTIGSRVLAAAAAGRDQKCDAE